MLSGFQNAHGVHEPVAALLGDHELQVRVIFQHGQIVTGIVHGDSGVAALHFAEHLIHDKGLVYALALGVCQQLIGFSNLSFIGGVDIIAEVQQCRSQSVPGVADHQDVVGVLLVEHGVPAVDVAVHHGGIVDDAQGAPGVGNGVLVLGIEAQALVLLADLRVVGDVVIVQLCQHTFVNETGDHIVRRDDDIVIRAADAEQGVQGFIALGGLVVDLDAGLVLEFVDQVLVNVFTPAANIHNTLAAAVTAAGIGIRIGICAAGKAVAITAASGQEQACRHGYSASQG